MTVAATMPASTEVTTLPLDKIRLDGGTQPRAVLDFDAIEVYADAMKVGAKFPPMDVFYDGSTYWLADGFHRYKAAFECELETFPCNVHQGTVEDAQWFSFSVNQANGLYRSNADKQRAVKAALGHPKGAGLSNVQVAKHVGVEETMIRAWREKLSPSSVLPKIRTVTRKGTTYQQDTTSIGKTSRAEPLVPKAEDGIRRTWDRLEQKAMPVEETFDIEAALIHIMLDIMTSPLHLRGELIRRLREGLDVAASLEASA